MLKHVGSGDGAFYLRDPDGHDGVIHEPERGN